MAAEVRHQLSETELRRDWCLQIYLLLCFQNYRVTWAAVRHLRLQLGLQILPLSHSLLEQ